MSREIWANEVKVSRTLLTGLKLAGWLDDWMTDWLLDWLAWQTKRNARKKKAEKKRKVNTKTKKLEPRTLPRVGSRWKQIKQNKLKTWQACCLSQKQQQMHDDNKQKQEKYIFALTNELRESFAQLTPQAIGSNATVDLGPGGAWLTKSKPE